MAAGNLHPAALGIGARHQDQVMRRRVLVAGKQLIALPGIGRDIAGVLAVLDGLRCRAGRVGNESAAQLDVGTRGTGQRRRQHGQSKNNTNAHRNPRLKKVGDRLKLSPCQNCDILLAKRKKHRRAKSG
ncbi:hypothetical protein ACVDG5_013075 [Mesorhizobium sp. ORM6]